MTLGKKTQFTKQQSILPIPTLPFIRIMALTITILAVIGAIVAVAVVYSTKTVQEESPEVQYVSAEPTSSPSLAPTSNAFLALHQEIERNVLKRNATFSNMSKSDPRVLALDWMLNKDEMKHDDTSKLRQRYTLALIGIQFDYRAWFNNGTDQTSFDWLTITEDECKWFGVSCSDDGKVTAVELREANIPS